MRKEESWCITLCSMQCTGAELSLCINSKKHTAQSTTYCAIQNMNIVNSVLGHQLRV